jgi:hypothetical protein
MPFTKKKTDKETQWMEGNLQGINGRRSRERNHHPEQSRGGGGRAREG